MGFSTRGVTTADIDAIISNKLPILKWDATLNDFASVAGTWVESAVAALHLGNRISVTVPAINDEVSFGSFLILTAVDYTIHFLVRTDTDSGIAHIYIDGVDTAQIDLYSGGTVNNEDKSVSLGTIAVGLHHIKIKMESKHGSSADYAMSLQSLLIVPTP